MAAEEGAAKGQVALCSGMPPNLHAAAGWVRPSWATSSLEAVGCHPLFYGFWAPTKKKKEYVLKTSYILNYFKAFNQIQYEHKERTLYLIHFLF